MESDRRDCCATMVGSIPLFHSNLKLVDYCAAENSSWMINNNHQLEIENNSGQLRTISLQVMEAEKEDCDVTGGGGRKHHKSSTMRKNMPNVVHLQFWCFLKR
ncbi:hypothetical protein PIB30_020945, partial [Stylosanthes scabra]|nr:hypothetical protein [Stylosanthes scabra]